MNKITSISMSMLAGASVLLSSCVVDPGVYAGVSVSPGGVSASVAWTSASYDANGFPIYGYSYGRPVYGYTDAGVAIFTVAALTALCFVPDWGPAPWYRGHWHYPPHIHHCPAPPRYEHGHRPYHRPPGGLNAPVHKHPPYPAARPSAPKPHHHNNGAHARPNNSRPNNVSHARPNNSRPNNVGHARPNNSRPNNVSHARPNNSRPNNVNHVRPNNSRPNNVNHVRPNNSRPNNVNHARPNNSRPNNVSHVRPNNSRPNVNFSSAGGSRPSMGSSRPSMGGSRPSMGGSRPSMGGARPSGGGGRGAGRGDRR